MGLGRGRLGVEEGRGGRRGGVGGGKRGGEGWEKGKVEGRGKKTLLVKFNQTLALLLTSQHIAVVYLFTPLHTHIFPQVC